MTQQYVLVLSVSVKYVLVLSYVLSVLLVPSVLLVHLSPGLAVQQYRLLILRDLVVQISLISTSFNVILPPVIQHLMFTTFISIC